MGLATADTARPLREANAGEVQRRIGCHSSLAYIEQREIAPDRILEALHSELRANGYFAASRGTSRWSDIKRVILSLGGTRVHSVRIGPRSANEARPNTLSSLYGYEKFPIHTDYALDNVPPRYILLAAPRVRRVKTYIYDAKRVDIGLYNVLSRSLFLIVGSREPFYSRFIERIAGKEIVRYNGAIARPVNEYANEACSFLSSWAPDGVINWRYVKWVLVDNWRCLHSRSALGELSDPKAFRIAIWVE